jgi:hypothetical protein
LWSVDSGQGVRLDGLADSSLREVLEKLFCACRLRHTPAGYVARASATPLLRSIGSVFDEALQPEPPSVTLERRHAKPIGPARPPRAEEVYSGPAPEEARGVESDSEHVKVSTAPIGPQAGPSLPPLLQSPLRRVLGPAAPSRELLLQVDSGGALLGPVPPELVAEAATSSVEEREAATERLLQLAAATPPADAYELLGLTDIAGSGDVRRAFWRLSLLIHPDKCAHPQAADAFALLSSAKNVLAEPGARATLDAARAERALRAEFEADMRGRLEAAQWRRARGLAPSPGDDELLSMAYGGTAEAGRDSWMTELPPERRPAAGPPTASVTAFSRRGVEGRGDVRGWTSLPGDQEAPAMLSSGGVSLLTAHTVADSTAHLVDEHNRHLRGQTLVDKHRAARGLEPAAAAAAPSSLFFTGGSGASRRTFL